MPSSSLCGHCTHMVHIYCSNKPYTWVLPQIYMLILASNAMRVGVGAIKGGHIMSIEPLTGVLVKDTPENNCPLCHVSTKRWPPLQQELDFHQTWCLLLS